MKSLWKYLLLAFITVAVIFSISKYMDTSNTQNNPENDASGLVISDLIVGSGAEAVCGKTLSVHYRGTLTDGTQFDASYDRGEPFEFTLCAGQVIKGWEQGVLGMKVGGKRKLTIPPELGYGEQGAGPIPPNTVLFFEVELLSIK